MEELILDYKEVQQIARETIEYAKTFIKPGMNLLEVRKLCEQKMLELGADSLCEIMKMKKENGIPKEQIDGMKSKWRQYKLTKKQIVNIYELL